MPVRVHGAFVSDQEVHAWSSSLRVHAAPIYIDEILDGPSMPIPGMPGEAGEGEGGEGGDAEQDPLYDEAVKIVTESRKASISGVQRRLKIGYNRAARMIEAMEAAGLVGPAATPTARAKCWRRRRRKWIDGARSPLPLARRPRAAGALLAMLAGCRSPRAPPTPWPASTRTWARSRPSRPSSCRSCRTSRARSPTAPPAR